MADVPQIQDLNWPSHPYGWEFDGSINRAPHHFASAMVVDDFGSRYPIRRCGHCRRWFERVTDHFGPRSRHPDGSVKRWDNWCRECRKAAARRYYHQTPEQQLRARRRARHRRLRSNPEWLAKRRAANAAYMREKRKNDPEANQKACRKYYESLKADPEKWAKFLAASRERYRVRQVLGGTVPLPKKKDASTGPRLIAHPLHMAVEKYLQRVQRMYGDEVTESAACRNLNLEPKSVYDWRKGIRRTVKMDLVDRVLTAAGWNWFDVYQPPPNGHATGCSADVLRYISEAEEYFKVVRAFTGEDTLDYA